MGAECQRNAAVPPALCAGQVKYRMKLSHDTDPVGVIPCEGRKNLMVHVQSDTQSTLQWGESSVLSDDVSGLRSTQAFQNGRLCDIQNILVTHWPHYCFIIVSSSYKAQLYMNTRLSRWGNKKYRQWLQLFSCWFHPLGYKLTGKGEKRKTQNKTNTMAGIFFFYCECPMPYFLCSGQMHYLI